MDNETTSTSHLKQRIPKEPPYASTSSTSECAIGWCFLRLLALICCFPLGIASFIFCLFTRRRAQASSPKEESKDLRGEKFPLREVSTSGGDSCENAVKISTDASSATRCYLHMSRMLAIMSIVFGSILVALSGILVGMLLAKGTNW